jgi:hypothetical protein
MANRKVVDADKLEADIKTVADAIREKGGTTDELAFPNGMATAVEAIQTGGGDEPAPPADGKTRIYITLQGERKSPMLGVCPNGTVTVDWGDGTTPDTLTGTRITSTKFTPTHNYAEAGDYVITLTVDGEMGLIGINNSESYGCILRHSSGADIRNYSYHNSIWKVELGDGVTSIGDYSFFGCCSIRSVTIPNSVSYIGKYAFNACSSMKSVNIPSGVSTIETYSFGQCKAISHLIIPSGVTKIGSSAFLDCYSALCCDFSAFTSVPTLSNTSAFLRIPPDCEFLIPSALYDEWSNATNWTTYASQMKAV